MALHFTAYKLVDLVYSIIISDTLENRLKFVTSYKLGLLYAFIAILLILPFLKIKDFVKSKISKI